MAVSYVANSSTSTVGTTSATFSRSGFHAKGDIIVFSVGSRLNAATFGGPTDSVLIKRASGTITSSHEMYAKVIGDETSWTLTSSDSKTQYAIVGSFAGGAWPIDPSAAATTEQVAAVPMTSIAAVANAIIVHSTDNSAGVTHAPRSPLVELTDQATDTKGNYASFWGGYQPVSADGASGGIVDASAATKHGVVSAQIKAAAAAPGPPAFAGWGVPL